MDTEWWCGEYGVVVDSIGLGPGRLLRCYIRHSVKSPPETRNRAQAWRGETRI